jgi:uncharacterized membrane protein (DUF4010 family)
MINKYMGIEVFAQQLFFAVLVGALVGIEREHTRRMHHDQLPFGMRTTILFSVLGFLFAYSSVLMDSDMIIFAGLLVAIIFTTSVYIANIYTKKHTGATSYVAMLVVFFMGILVGFGGYQNLLIAAALSISVTGLLLSKKYFVNWTVKLTDEEIFSAVKFGIIAFIILPLLPDKFIDPFGVINLYRIWYVVVLVSAVYFLSYVLLKHFAEKGIAYSAMFGGLISTSITTFDLSIWLRKDKKLFGAVTSGVFLACITGFFSDIFILGFVLNQWELLMRVLPAMFAAMFVLFIFAYMHFEHKQHEKEIKISSPFAFMPAFKFGVMYLGLVVLTFTLNSVFGSYGIYPVAVIASVVSSTTFIASVGNILQQQQIALTDAVYLVIMSSVVSLLVKMFWVREANNEKFSKEIAMGVIAAAAAMVATVLVQQLVFA